MQVRIEWKVASLSRRWEATCACALALSFFLLLCGFSNTYSFLVDVMPGRRVRAIAWSERHVWKSTECIVIAAGVAYRGGCARQDEITDPLNAPKAFIDPASFSECPGTSWCADEGEMCACTGEIRFAGVTYATTKADVDASISVVNSSGPILCSKSEGGPFFEDPAPGERKACFCTSQTIVEKMDGRNPHEHSCSSAVNDDYEALHVRRLWAQKRSLAELQGLDGSGNVCYILYLPWALVEVDGYLRCAYEYGTPAASLLQELPRARSMVTLQNESNSSRLQCFVSNTVKDMCAVSLRPPRELVRDTENHEEIDRIRLVGCLAVFCFCWIPFCWWLRRASHALSYKLPQLHINKPERIEPLLKQ